MAHIHGCLPGWGRRIRFNALPDSLSSTTACDAFHDSCIFLLFAAVFPFQFSLSLQPVLAFFLVLAVLAQYLTHQLGLQQNAKQDLKQ